MKHIIVDNRFHFKPFVNGSQKGKVIVIANFKPPARRRITLLPKISFILSRLRGG
jgi:hypothetical protein